VSDRSVERVLAQLPAEAWDPPTPPPLVLPETAHRARAPRRRRGWSLAPRPLAAAALAALLLALGFAGGSLLTRGDEAAGPERMVELQPLPAAGGSAAGGRVSVSARTVELDVARLRPSRGGEFYELWLLTPPNRLVSLGSFRVPASGAAKVRVPLPTDPRGFQLFDVSVEPGDGDPSHSGRSVLRAPTS
jgi:anti-sigma-K factor RskA